MKLVNKIAKVPVVLLLVLACVPWIQNCGKKARYEQIAPPAPQIPVVPQAEPMGPISTSGSATPRPDEVRDREEHHDDEIKYTGSRPGGGDTTSGGGCQEAARVCYPANYQQPDGNVTNDLDILFVIDTSGSLKHERGLIADGIDRFVEQLPQGMSFNIGVIPGHSPVSGNNGKLIVDHGEAAVLKSNEMDISQIREALRAKLLSSTVSGAGADKHANGGELGLYSLNEAVTTRWQENQEAGMFRSSAALAVVMISDENDICSLGTYDNPRESVNFVDSTSGLTWERYAKNHYCQGITPENVYATVVNKKATGMPLMISAIVYPDNPPPSEDIQDENERGWGYIELAQLTGGPVVDIRSDIPSKLGEVGQTLSRKLSLKTEFILNQPGRVDPNSISVKVDGNEVNKSFLRPNRVHISLADAGSAGSKVDISWCADLYGGGSTGQAGSCGTGGGSGGGHFRVGPSRGSGKTTVTVDTDVRVTAPAGSRIHVTNDVDVTIRRGGTYRSGPVRGGGGSGGGVIIRPGGGSGGGSGGGQVYVPRFSCVNRTPGYRVYDSQSGQYLGLPFPKAENQGECLCNKWLLDPKGGNMPRTAVFGKCTDYPNGRPVQVNTGDAGGGRTSGGRGGLFGTGLFGGGKTVTGGGGAWGGSKTVVGGAPAIVGPRFTCETTPSGYGIRDHSTGQRLGVPTFPNKGNQGECLCNKWLLDPKGGGLSPSQVHGACSDNRKF